MDGSNYLSQGNQELVKPGFIQLIVKDPVFGPSQGGKTCTVYR